MRLKKMTAVALAAALAAGSFGGTTAFAADTTTTNDITLSTTVQNNTVKYVLSIPSGTKTIESAKDTFSNVGTLQVKHLDSEADVKFDNTKKVSVAVTYSGNLTNTDNTITSNNKLAYKLVKGTKDSNTDIASGTTYDFSADDIDKATGSVAIGAVVTGDPTQVENGTYEDKVTFTASVEEAKQLHSFTLTGPYTGETLVVEYYEGDTWNDMAAKYPNTIKIYNGYAAFGSDGFIYEQGTGGFLSATAQINPNKTYEVS
ncbi:MAG: hypothetical protein IJ733_09195 [Lachnospiraceae bacterium]|nr:hypothetical protein [Lachnospiraceae bacterium]